MMAIDNDTKKLIDLLGWQWDKRHGYSGCLDTGTGIVRSEIELAAYAKAEMAKRGWHVRSGAGSTVAYDVFEMFGPTVQEIIRAKFDRTDPLSEARAIIEACIEALELENA